MITSLSVSSTLTRLGVEDGEASSPDPASKKRGAMSSVLGLVLDFCRLIEALAVEVISTLEGSMSSVLVEGVGREERVGAGSECGWGVRRDFGQSL
jgi:hypothetical protein